MTEIGISFNNSDYRVELDLEESKEVPVVQCPVNDVITHSEDEKPLACKDFKKKVDFNESMQTLRKLTEGYSKKQLEDLAKLCQQYGVITVKDLVGVCNEVQNDNPIVAIREYARRVGTDFEIQEDIKQIPPSEEATEMEFAPDDLERLAPLEDEEPFIPTDEDEEVLNAQAFDLDFQDADEEEEAYLRDLGSRYDGGYPEI